MTRKNVPVRSPAIPDSVKADAAEVVAAATALSDPLDTTIQRVLTEAADGFVPAVAIQSAAPFVDLVETSSDEAARLARAEADRLNALEPEVETLPLPDFPADFQIMNNGRISVSEPLSGAYLAAGSMATITVQDEEHLNEIATSLAEIAVTNYISASVFSIQAVTKKIDEVAP